MFDPAEQMRSDEALYQQVHQGDLAAFDVLYERYERRLFSYLLRMTGSRVDAEDLMHEAFLSVLRSPEVDLNRATFCTWLYRIARNRCLNHLRSARRADHALVTVAAEAPAPAPSAEVVYQEGALLRALHEAVSRLPAPLSELFHLRSSGLSYEQMAQVLEVPLGTVKSRMNQMMNQLRLEVSPWTA